MTNKANDFADFFETHGEYVVHVNYYEVDRAFTVEELYQAIKARLQHESTPSLDTLYFRAMITPPRDHET